MTTTSRSQLSSTSSNSVISANPANGIASGAGGPVPPQQQHFPLELLANLLAHGQRAQVATPGQPQQSVGGIPQFGFAPPPAFVGAPGPPPAVQQLLRATNPLLMNQFVQFSPQTLLQHAAVLAASLGQHKAAAMATPKEEGEEEEAAEDNVVEEEEEAMDVVKMEQQQVDEAAQNGDNNLDAEGGQQQRVQASPTAGERPRKQRVGGASVKTAVVWRFFTQKPPPEQAATCQICQKTIKATNSSTTGMLRHLRSCHREEHQQVQQARVMNALKSGHGLDDAARETMLLQLGIAPNTDVSIDAIKTALAALQSPPPPQPQLTPAPKHSVEALINGHNGTADSDNRQLTLSPNVFAANSQQPMSVDQRQLLEQIEKFKTSRPTSMERSKKEGSNAAVENNNNGQNGEGVMAPLHSPTEAKPPKRQKVEVPMSTMIAICPSQQTPKVGKRTNNNGGGANRKQLQQRETVQQMEHLESGVMSLQHNGALNVATERINEQLAAMVLMDRTEFLLDRAGFRQFVHSVLPHYVMPSSEQFRAEIIPRVAKHLQQMAAFQEELQRNNPFGLTTALQQCSASSSNNSPHSSSHHHSSAANSVISPSSSTEESGFHDDDGGASDGSALMMDKSTASGALGLDELVQQAAFHSQNISRSFNFSIDLDGEQCVSGIKKEGGTDSDTTSSSV